MKSPRCARAKPTESKKIRVIEDQAPMRRNLALLLELEGYQVGSAENGRLGLEIAQRNRPDLII